MKKNKEDGMTDLEIIKKNFNIITESEGYDYWYELEKEALDAATRMAAENERLLNIIVENQKEMSRLRNEAVKLMIERDSLKAALAEKPDIVRCGECKHLNYKKDVCILTGLYNSDDTFSCSYGRRKEAKDED